MADRSVHYEAAFEAFLRQKGIPYVAVDEAKRAQVKLEVLERKRVEVWEQLSPEAAAMLEALEELRAKQTVADTTDEEGPVSE